MDETGPRRRGRRPRGRRAGGARGRIACARTPRRARGTNRRFSDPCRSTRRAGAGGRAARGAADEVEAPAGLRARLEAQRSARTVAHAAAPGARRGRRGRGWSSPWRSASPSAARARTVARFQAALASTPLAPEARGEATLTRTSSGWRIHLDAIRASAPRRAAASTRPGCGTRPACSCRSGRSTRAGT